jgi:hypothetical protein
VLLDTGGDAALSWFDICAKCFDVDSTRSWSWLGDGGRSGDKQQGNAQRQN